MCIAGLRSLLRPHASLVFAARSRGCSNISRFTATTTATAARLHCKMLVCRRTRAEIQKQKLPAYSSPCGTRSLDHIFHDLVSTLCNTIVHAAAHRRRCVAYTHQGLVRVHQPRNKHNYPDFGAPLLDRCIRPEFCPGEREPVAVGGRSRDVGIRFKASMTAELADAQRLH
jgi:hypothetical protein